MVFTNSMIIAKVRLLFDNKKTDKHLAQLARLVFSHVSYFYKKKEAEL